jgi:hypothetical protein
MNNIRTISYSQDTIAAIHLKGQWRFFYDMDYRFLLDAESLVTDDSGEVDETQIVDDHNVEAWMQSLSGELTAEEIPYTYWEDGGQVKLTFVIDFDRKL